MRVSYNHNTAQSTHKLSQRVIGPGCLEGVVYPLWQFFQFHEEHVGFCFEFPGRESAGYGMLLRFLIVEGTVSRHCGVRFQSFLINQPVRKYGYEKSKSQRYRVLRNEDELVCSQRARPFTGFQLLCLIIA